MENLAGSRGDGQSVNWRTSLTHLNSRQACTHAPTSKEVDGEALHQQGEPRRAWHLRDSDGLAYPGRRCHSVSGLAPPRHHY